MDQNFTALGELTLSFSERGLPAWEQLPELELYMDQVISLVHRYIPESEDTKQLTAAMVNNYVKMGAMPPPVKRRYSRSHVAYLLMICILKQVLPMNSVCDIIRTGLQGRTEEELYQRFRQIYDETGSDAIRCVCQSGAENGDNTFVLFAALRAQAEQSIVTQLLSREAQERKDG